MTWMSDDISLIKLADALAALRVELTEAVERARQAEGIEFKLNDIEVEFQLVAERKNTGEGGGEIAFELFGRKIGADAKYAREWGGSRTHTIRFRLNASDPANGQELNLSRNG